MSIAPTKPKVAPAGTFKMAWATRTPYGSVETGIVDKAAAAASKPPRAPTTTICHGTPHCSDVDAAVCSVLAAVTWVVLVVLSGGVQRGSHGLWGGSNENTTTRIVRAAVSPYKALRKLRTREWLRSDTRSTAARMDRSCARNDFELRSAWSDPSSQCSYITRSASSLSRYRSSFDRSTGSWATTSSSDATVNSACLAACSETHERSMSAPVHHRRILVQGYGARWSALLRATPVFSTTPSTSTEWA